MQEQSKNQSNRWMKGIVKYCIVFTSVVIVACYIASWFGIDTDAQLQVTAMVFGGELLMTVVIKLMGDSKEKKEETKEKIKIPIMEDKKNG